MVEIEKKVDRRQRKGYYIFMRTKIEQLTGKQLQLLKIIENFLDREKRFPTVRELCRLSGRSSPATIEHYLLALEKRGLIGRREGRWQLYRGNGVPLVGVVPAGVAREAFYPLEEELELPPWLGSGQNDLVALRVTGDSMIDAYIQDGDLVILRLTSAADPEQMVVARVEGSEITLKRLRRNENGFYLAPENPSYQPIFKPFEVLGIVVGVLRKYR